jgi:type VI secretion system protein ImpC
MARTPLAQVHIDVAEEAQPIPRPQPNTPFRILVAGDLSGGAARIRKPVQLDRDNFDEVLTLFAPELSIEFAGKPLPVRFRELDDFHPDRLYRRLPPFQALRDLRERVADGAVIPPSPADPAPAGAASAAGTPPPPDMSGADLLRSMMGDGPAPAAAPAPAPSSQWDQMLHQMVSRYAEPKPDPRRPQYLKQTDAAIAGEMRGLLHLPAFQTVEAAWRSLYFLVRRLDTGDSLKVYVLDLPQDQVATPEGLALLRRIAVEETVSIPGSDPWAAIAGLYYFGPRHEPALAQIASIARQAGAPFLAGVASEVVGITRVFDELRRSPLARWVGLAMPRFLLRMPYGAKADATEEFEFEELSAQPEHEHYLWANPAVACACLLGEAFSRYGWDMRPGAVNQVEGLPLHVFEQDGEPVVKPCAEVLLTEEAVEMLLDRGFMPLISTRNSDRVRLGRFQSIADPSATLAGRWE